MKFLKALLVFIHAYMDGFFLSESTRYDKDGTHWGFYRFNHKNQASLFDIDFQFSKTQTSYAHVHGDDYQFDFDKSKNATKVSKKNIRLPYNYEPVNIHHL